MIEFRLVADKDAIIPTGINFESDSEQKQILNDKILKLFFFIINQLFEFGSRVEPKLLVQYNFSTHILTVY